MAVDTPKLSTLVDTAAKMKSFFRDPEGEFNKDYALREHIVCDQGCGGAYCSNCSANVTDEYDACPKCKLPLVEGGMYVQGGGSDF
jgi:ferredoxin